VLAFNQFYRRDRPLAVVTSDRDAQAVKFIQPNMVYRPSLSVGQDDGFADNLGLSLAEFHEDGERSRFDGWHGVARLA
jgi:hypothetical protein